MFGRRGRRAGRNLVRQDEDGTRGVAGVGEEDWCGVRMRGTRGNVVLGGKGIDRSSYRDNRKNVNDN